MNVFRSTYMIWFAVIFSCVGIHSAEAVKIKRQSSAIDSLTGGANNTNALQSIKGSTSADLMKNLADDAIFVQIGDSDKVTWGMLHNYIDSAINMKIAHLLSAAPNDQMGGVRIGLYQQAISKTLQKYLGAAVIAYDAKQKGLKIPDAEFEAQINELKKKSPNPSPLQYQFLTNGVYQKAYVEKYLKSELEISDAAVTNLIARRHMANLAVPATNAIFKTQITELRKKIINQEKDFAEVAEEYSDCADCSSNGGDCGTWEEDDSSIDDALLKVCFSVPTNTLSEVVETPDAYHIVKIVSKYVPTKKAREEDGEVSSVDVKHIQINKWMTDPEFTKQTAYDFIEQRLLTHALMIRQQELMDIVPIKSILPIKAKESDSRKAEAIRKILDKARKN